MKRKCLLVTGTIVPNSNYVSITDFEERIKEYYSSLEYYSSHFQNLPIYFLENSKYDFSSDKKFTNFLNERKINLMKFPVSDKFEEGKGFQEFEMLDQAIEKLSGKYDAFIKVTGRYIVRNLDEIIDKEINGIVIDQHKKKKISLTNVFCSTFEFYNKYLKGVYKDVNDSKGIIVEQVVYEKLKSVEARQTIELFQKNLTIEGISGSYGQSIQRNKLKMFVRGIERKLLRLFNINEFLIEY